MQTLNETQIFKITTKNRVLTLDWLRGGAALSIMFYHLIFWNIAPLDAGSCLGRLGIYAVSIFFILSGLSMAIVYSKYIKSVLTSIGFLVRRIFRIWPLLWIVTTIVFVFRVLEGNELSFKSILIFGANLTTVFGFIKPDAYMAAGVWSVGNEMVYYAMTPIIIALFNRKRVYGNILFAGTIIIGAYFAFYLLDPSVELGPKQWKTYINPFNNLFFYVGGIAMYYNLKDVEIKPIINNSMLVLVVVIFCFLPISGDDIVIATSFYRGIFSLLCFVIVVGFYKLWVRMPDIIGLPLEMFGIATYGVYLLHPIVNKVFSGFFINKVLLIIVVALVKVVIALASYYLFEIKMILVGRTLSKKYLRV